MVDVYFTCAGATYEAGGVDLCWVTSQHHHYFVERRFTAKGESVGDTFLPAIDTRGRLVVALDDRVEYDGRARIDSAIPGEVVFVATTKPRRCRLPRPRSIWLRGR